MNKHRSIQFMTWTTLLFITAAAACCSSINVPDHVNVPDVLGAAKHQALREVQP